MKMLFLFVVGNCVVLLEGDSDPITMNDPKARVEKIRVINPSLGHKPDLTIEDKETLHYENQKETVNI